MTYLQEEKEAVDPGSKKQAESLFDAHNFDINIVRSHLPLLNMISMNLMTQINN